MDTSKEYIEMCRKAVEVQELWEPNVSDYHTCGCSACRKRQANIFIIERATMDIIRNRDFTNTCEIYTAYAKNYGQHFWDNFIECRELMVFLPRQDQLWKLIPKSVKWIDFERDVKFKEGIGLRLCAQIPISVGVTNHWNIGGFSIEQLLLKLFYKAQFNKTWNGENWIKE